MKRKKILEIAAHFSSYDVKYSDSEERFEIIDPYEGKDPIVLY